MNLPLTESDGFSDGSVLADEVSDLCILSDVFFDELPIAGESVISDDALF